MQNPRLAMFALACAVAAAGCAPRLVIRHQDPAAPFVQVKIDGVTHGFVEPFGTFSVRVPRGYHRVETVPRGDEANPWAPDGSGWTIYVDRRADVTLLPFEK